MKKFFLLLLLTSCATIESSVPIESRTYDLSPKLDAFIWGYEVCTKKFLGFCRKKEIKHERIEVKFKDEKQAKQFYDLNFVFKQRQKPF